MAVFVGALVALTYGAADFFGGFSSKRLSTVTVLVVSQAFGLAGALLIVAALGDLVPPPGDLLLGATAGAVGLVALGLLYRGLAVGRMSVVAPLSAVGAGVLPVAWGLLRGERPGVVAMLGVLFALVAVVVIARTAEHRPTATASANLELLLGAGAGIGFGVVFICFSETGSDSGMWPVLAARAVSAPIVLVVALAGRQALAVRGGLLLPVAVSGVLDMGANALLVVAVRRGLISLVAPIAALYPAGTVLLARLVLGERIGRARAVGLAVALAGLVLIATR